jgi:two-component system, response regulator / RNA-binding antiterminator
MNEQMTFPVSADHLRVLLIQRSDERLRIIERALAQAGHRIVAQVGSMELLHEEAEHARPDLVIVDTVAADADTLAQIARMNEHLPRPVIVFTDDGDRSRIHAAVRCGVTSYVVDGFAPERIEAIVRVALARFESDQSLRAERDQARAKLAERKLIDRAKGILMRKRGISEDEAYHALRRIAMDRNVRMSEVAEQLIGMSDWLG